MKFLVAVDGSACSSRAVEHLIRRVRACSEHLNFEVHVLNVQMPLRRNVGMFLDASNIKEYYQEEGAKAIQPARDLLDAASVKHEFHLEVGRPAEEIARYARERGIDEVFMGTRGLGNVADVLIGSTSEAALREISVPLVLVK